MKNFVLTVAFGLVVAFTTPAFAEIPRLIARRLVANGMLRPKLAQTNISLGLSSASALSGVGLGRGREALCLGFFFELALRLGLAVEDPSK
jgi:hypothetical protein